MFGILTLMGVDAVYHGHVVASRKVATSQRWIEARCEIVDSYVDVHSDSDHGDSYSLHVKYRYEVDRQEYMSDRYDFSHGAPSQAEAETAVAGLPSGTQTVCYVNPADPSEAVLKREWRSGSLFGGGAMVTLGTLGMLLTMIVGTGKNPVGLFGDAVFWAVEQLTERLDRQAIQSPQPAVDNADETPDHRNR